MLSTKREILTFEYGSIFLLIVALCFTIASSVLHKTALMVVAAVIAGLAAIARVIVSRRNQSFTSSSKVEPNLRKTENRNQSSTESSDSVLVKEHQGAREIELLEEIRDTVSGLQNQYITLPKTLITDEGSARLFFESIDSNVTSRGRITPDRNNIKAIHKRIIIPFEEIKKRKVS